MAIRAVLGTLALSLLGAGGGLVLGTQDPRDPQDPQDAPRSIGRIDGSSAFVHPDWASEPEVVVAELGDRPIRAAELLRHLASRAGAEAVADLAFDLALAAECRARGLIPAAPILARGMAARQLVDSGRSAADDPFGDLQRTFANDALRQLRIDAVVQADRQVTEAELRALFERRHGPDGRRETLRQVVIGRTATRERLRAGGGASDPAAVERAARRRAEDLRDRLRDGAEFAELLAESDHVGTRRALAAGDRDAAGRLDPDTARRYGAEFSAAVAATAEGGVAGPLETRLGFHLVLVEARRVTAFADVAADLERDIRHAATAPREVAELRRRLLDEHGYRRLR